MFDNFQHVVFALYVLINSLIGLSGRDDIARPMAWVFLAVMAVWHFNRWMKG